MRDARILELFFRRDQEAIRAVQEQYGAQLRYTAQAILHSGQDAEECVNDALLEAWKSIPPKKPDPLLPWLLAVTRNLALRQWARDHALKRGGGELALALEELEEVLPGGENVAQAVERAELAGLLEKFLSRQTARNKAVFLGRYFYGLSWAQVAARLDLTEDACKMRAGRLRKRLRNYLKKEGGL